MSKTIKSATNSQNNDVKQKEERHRKTRVLQSEIPTISLTDALKIAEAIRDNYAEAPTKPLNIAVALDMSPGSGSFRTLIGASAAYGLTEGSFNAETISITETGRKIISQKTDGTKQSAMKNAFLKPRVIKSFLEKYNNAKLPQDKVAKNILEEIGVPSDSSKQAFNLILNGAKQLGLVHEVKGSFWVDLDRVSSNASISTDNSDNSENDDDPSNSESTDNENNLPKEEFDEGAETSKNFSPPEVLDPTKPKNNRVFITHGKNKEIVNQLREF